MPIMPLYSYLSSFKLLLLLWNLCLLAQQHLHWDHFKQIPAIYVYIKSDKDSKMFFHLANNNNSIRVAVYCIIHILTTGGNGFHHKLYKHYCCNKFENCEHGETLRCPLSWSKFIVAQLQWHNFAISGRQCQYSASTGKQVTSSSEKIKKNDNALLPRNLPRSLHLTKMMQSTHLQSDSSPWPVARQCKLQTNFDIIFNCQ